VHSHPQASGQCARFLRSQLPAATIVAASSTAEAVRASLPQTTQPAALGNRLAAELYSAHILRADVDDEPDNVTRFVWLAKTERRASCVACSSGRVHEDLDRVLGWWRRGGGLARELPRRAVGARHQPDADRVAARRIGSATTCSSPISKARPATHHSPPRSTACAIAARKSSPRLLPHA